MNSPVFVFAIFLVISISTAWLIADYRVLAPARRKSVTSWFLMLMACAAILAVFLFH